MRFRQILKVLPSLLAALTSGMLCLAAPRAAAATFSAERFCDGWGQLPPAQRRALEEVFGPDNGFNDTKIHISEDEVWWSYHSGMPEHFGFSGANAQSICRGLQKVLAEHAGSYLDIKYTAVGEEDVGVLFNLKALHKLYVLYYPDDDKNLVRLSAPLTPNTTLKDFSVQASGRNCEPGASGWEHLASLRALEELGIYTVCLDNLRFLEPLTSVTSLELHSNGLKTVDGLSTMIQLRHLGLVANDVLDLSPIMSLVNVTDLLVYGNGSLPVTNVWAVQYMVNLAKLEMSYAKLTDISPLAGLAYLSDLTLMTNEVRDLSPLKNLKLLKFLDLTGNQVSDLAPLAELEIADLRLVANQVASLAPLAGSAFYRENADIDIGNNPIARDGDFDELRKTFKKLSVF